MKYIVNGYRLGFNDKDSCEDDIKCTCLYLRRSNGKLISCRASFDAEDFAKAYDELLRMKNDIDRAFGECCRISGRVRNV